MDRPRDQEHSLRPPMPPGDVRHVEQWRSIRGAGIQDVKHRLEVAIKVNCRFRVALKGEGFLAIVPPAVHRTLGKPGCLSLADSDLPSVNNCRQSACYHPTLLRLLVVDMERWSFSMGRKCTLELQPDLSVSGDPSQLKSLTGVPIVKDEVVHELQHPR